jgi:hypothetical protein
VSPDRNETFAAWREKDHDDILLALSLALWYGERFPGFDGNPYGAEYDAVPTLPPGVFDKPARDIFR